MKRGLDCRVWAAVVAMLVAGCSGGADVAVIGQPLPDLGGGPDLNIADVAGTDVLQTEDASADDTPVLDAAEDVAISPDVAVLPDIAVLPDVPVVIDVYTPKDVSLPKDAGVDAAPKDVGVDPCVKAYTDYLASQSKAMACSNPFACIEAVEATLGCKCMMRVSNDGLDYQAMKDESASFTSLGCKVSCPPAACADFTQQVGVCSSKGKCQTTNVPCAQLDTYAAAAMAEGVKCTADADCGFKSSVTLGCGCPVYTNKNTMGPAKPLFLYMTMLATAYKAKACTPAVTCDCFDPQSALCVDGKCVGQP